jgi:translation elongation factor EF-Tu-like GTPase
MFRMAVQDVFFIRGRGVVATGRVEYGVLRVGDEVQINAGPSVRVDGIEAFRKVINQATEGDNIGVLFSSLDKGELAAGDVLTSPGESGPTIW